MKIIYRLSSTFILVTLFANLHSQTNLILNPGFESGTVPTAASGIPANFATHWNELGFPYFYPNGDPNPSVNVCVPATSDLLDSRATNCIIDIPQNDWGNLNVRSTGNRYVSFAGGLWTLIPGSSPAAYRYRWGETISGTPSEYLDAGCTYEISFWAANPTYANRGCATNPNLMPATGSYNKIEVVLRKSGTSANDCQDYLVVWTSPNITSTSWTNFKGTFSLTAAEAAKNYDKIDFRFTDFPESEKGLKSNTRRRIFLDDVSLVNTTPTVTPNITHTNLNVNSNTTWNNEIVKLTGTTTLNADLTINNNSQVILTTNSKIVVKSGRTLTIENSTLEGTCSMWDQIEVENGGEIVIDGSNIYDMVNGVFVAGTTSKFTIENSTFDRNLVSLRLFDINMVSTSSIVSSNNFNAKQALKDKTLTPSGFGKYGIRIIDCVGKTSIGTSTGGGNTFDGNKFGIWVDNSETDLYSNTFLNQRKAGVLMLNGSFFSLTSGDFPIINGKNENIYLNGNTFTSNEVGAEIIGRCDNCAFEGDNKFNSSKAHGIKISQAKGSDGIRIGTSSSGNDYDANTFEGNEVSSIYLYNNGQSQNNIGLTDILIGYNTFDNAINSVGVLIDEPAKGSKKVFKRLSIQVNRFTTIGTSIKYRNIYGSNGDLDVFSGAQEPSLSANSNTDTRIIKNHLTYNSSFNPKYVGVEGKNSTGVQINSNDIYNVSNHHWENKGIWVDYCENTLVTDNALRRTGYGLIAGGIALNSNYHCNRFSDNNTGLHLNFHALRNPSNVHGKLNGSGNYARHNSFDLQGNTLWRDDIHVYYSSTNNNQWVFLTGLTLPKISYTGVTGSIVNSNTGQNGCDFIDYAPPFDPDNGSTNPTTDQVEIFIDDYRLESYYINYDIPLIGTVNGTISKLIQVEDFFHEENFFSADSLLQTITTSNLVDSNYKIVLEELVTTRLSDTMVIPVDSAGIVSLTNIASQNSSVGGPAVYLARAILKYEQNLDFDEEDFKVEAIEGKTFNEDGCTKIQAGIPLNLVDEQGYVTQIPATLVSDDGTFRLDPLAVKRIDSTKKYGFTVPYPSNFSVSNTLFKTIPNWRDGGDINLVLKQIEEFEALDTSYTYSSDTLGTDIYGNKYSIQSVDDSGYRDILLIKADSLGSELWRKYYRGWAGLDDSASSIFVDNNYEHIYVGGITKDSNSINSIVLRYDFDGNLDFSKIYSDSTGQEVKTTGLYIASKRQINVRCTKGSQNFHLSYVMCNDIPEEIDSILGMPASGGTLSSVSNQENQIKPIIYPNPTNGLVYIGDLPDNRDFDIIIYNIAGKQVFNKKVSKMNNSLNLGSHKNGMYFYVIKENGASFVTRGKLILK